MVVPVLVLALLAHATPQHTASPNPDTAIRTLPSRLLHDFPHLAGRDPLVAVAIGGAMAALVHPADASIVNSFKPEATPEEVLDPGTTIGDTYVQVGAAATVYGFGLVSHRQGAAEFGSELLEALGVNGVLTQGLKYAVNRTRPNGGHHGFPSGHTSGAFATADLVEQRFGWKIGALAYATGVYVSLSRLGEHAHYPSDTIFGAALGIASARSVGAGHAAGGHPHTALKGFTIVPVASTSGAAILFVR